MSDAAAGAGRTAAPRVPAADERARSSRVYCRYEIVRQASAANAMIYGRP